MNKKKTLSNPFLLTGYYDKLYFCNRDEELSTLNDHYKNERNIVIYSFRRMGKTALIKYFLSELEKNEKAAGIYADIYSTSDISGAIEQITSAVYEKFGKTSSGVSSALLSLLSGIGVDLSFDTHSGAPKISLSYKQGQSAAKSLEALGEFLGNINKRIVICIDEFQHISNYPEQNAEAVFRSWSQNFPEIRFIFSGSHRNMMKSMFTEKKRPFYMSAQLLHLDPIPMVHYKKFIMGHFKKNKKHITPEIITSIYEWSKGQTYCIQLVCNKLFGLFDHIGDTELGLVYDEILEQHNPVYTDYFRMLTITQWKVLKSVAKEEQVSNPLSKEFIKTYNLGAASSVATALKKLTGIELIVYDQGRYIVHDVILSRWLQKLKTPN